MKSITFESVDLNMQLPEVVRQVDQEVITKNAVASLDFNPIHVNPKWAKKVNLLGEGTTIAHGMCTQAFMTSVITDWCYASGGFITRMESKFVNPVRPGDTVTSRGEVIELHPRGKDDSFAVIELTADTDKGIRVAWAKAFVRLPFAG